MKQETLKARIRNLLSPSYNLANMVSAEKYLVNDPVRDFIISEANQSQKSIHNLLKLIDQLPDNLVVTDDNKINYLIDLI